MNKYLLMSAAGVLASATGATAAEKSWHHASSGVQSVYSTATFSGSTITFCDAVTLAWNGANYEELDQETGCGSGYTGEFGVGSGIEGKTKGLKTNVDTSDSIEASRDYQLNLDFGVAKNGPKNGGTFGVYLTLVTTSGEVETEQFYSGHYYFGTPPNKAGAKHAIMPKQIDAKKINPLVTGVKIKKA